MQLLEKFLMAYGLAVLTWLAHEARQWRIWYQQNHGGAPDGPVAPKK